MSTLLDNYHPDIVPLVAQMKQALQMPIGAAAQSANCAPGPFRVVLARVSDQSRIKFQHNLDADMDWLLGFAEPAWVKSHVTDVEAFRATKAGERARAKVGMKPLYAPGTKRLIGGFLARGQWLFVFLLSSAAKADLPQSRNAATEAILACLLAVAHDDPHAMVTRPVLYAHALDRILRAEGYAWSVFDTLTRTYVLVDAAGRRFDALGADSKGDWTLITFGASRGRDDTARRFLIARLNKARAGNWPGTIAGLPRGFTPSAEPDENRRWNLTPTEEQLSVRRPVPDPQQRWVVRAIVAASLDPTVTTFAALARECGAAGITSRGADEEGIALDKMRDLTSAGRLLLSLEKIRAYSTGLLRHTETGVIRGQFSPGDGHRLTPRFPGDDLGAVSYDINVGLPETHGWSWGVTPEVWRDLLLKFWLPKNFSPEGWTWHSDPAGWDWDQIRSVAKFRGSQPTGRAATRQDMRPFSGLIRWSDETHRHLLSCNGSPRTGSDRYELRREAHRASRRDSAGTVYRMASTDGEPISSWSVVEFHKAWAQLAERALSQLLVTEPALDLGENGVRPTLASRSRTNLQDAQDVRARRAAKAQDLRDQIEASRSEAKALRSSAAHKRLAGDEESAREYEDDAAVAKQDLDKLSRSLDKLLALPEPEDDPAPPLTADFGTPAAVIAALRGPFESGAAPKALHDALDAIGASQTRLTALDATTVAMQVTVSLRRSDGTLAPSTVTGHIRRSRPNLASPEAKNRRAAAKDDLTRKWFYEGITLNELTNLSGASPEHAYRIVREQLATGTLRTVGQADLGALAAERIPQRGLRAAIAAHPAPEARACVWSSLNPSDPPPAHVHREYPALIAQTYRQSEHGWDPRHPVRDPRSDGRADALTVLRNLPDPTASIGTHDLAALVGVPVRHINAISTTTGRANTATPPSLQRVDGWDTPIPVAQPTPRRTVALIACPWSDCDGATADALVMLPEVLIGAEASTVCRSCMRPPTKNVALPDSYLLVIDQAEARTGAWVHCASGGCVIDLGAGPGVLWRWDDAPGDQLEAHPTCVPASQYRPTNEAIRQWASTHGHHVNERGRIPSSVRRAYLAAQAAPCRTEPDAAVGALT